MTRSSNITDASEPASSEGYTSPLLISRRLGTVLYALGVLGLIGVAFLLQIADRLGYESPPSQVEMPALLENVEVVWDVSGTFHIHADNREDLLRAQGWMHASDRLWQMEFSRLIGEGRLAELLGPPAVPADRVIRTLGLHRVAQVKVDYLSPADSRLFQAYCDGINSYLNSDAYRAPPELVLLRWNPEPWELEDTALILALMSISLSSNWAQEAVRASMEEIFEREDVALLLPDVFDGPYIIGDVAEGSRDRSLYPSGDGGAISKAVTENLNWSELARGILAFNEVLGLPSGGVGSNSWVVSGRHTRSGKPLLANDLHLGVSIPSLWISNGLHLPGHDITGVTLPGVPAVILGRTDSFAWGFSNTMADNQDLYIERPVEDDPASYWFRERKLPFQVRTEILNVRGEDPQVMEVRSTVHGPIINDVVVGMLYGAEELLELNQSNRTAETETDRSADIRTWIEQSAPVALRWSLYERGRELLTLSALLEARGWENVREAFRTFDCPGQNVIYADTSGFIAYQFTGSIPVRQGWDGSLPVPGWSGEYEWEGFVPFDDLPLLESPPGGIIITANNRPRPPGEGPFLGRWWTPSHRAERIGDLIGVNGSHTVETFEDIQRDVLSKAALEIVGTLRSIPSSGSFSERAIDLLGKWDGRIARAGPGALYEVFLTQFFESVLLDEMGREGLRDYMSLLQFYEGRQKAVLALLNAPEAKWWDDTGSETVESREEILEQIWEKAWHELTSHFGTDPETWEWGEMHRLIFRHPLGGPWPLGNLMNRGPLEMSGDNETIYSTSFSIGHSYDTVVVSSWRHIVELSTPLKAREILPTGNTGHFLSPFYDDQLADWIDGRTRPSATTWEEARVAPTGEMLIVPGRSRGGR